MQIKIGDFGLASKIELGGEPRNTLCGTPNYIAPEVLEGPAEGHSYEVDVWALGVIVYTLLFGKPPYESNNVKLTYKKIMNNKFSYPENSGISAFAKDLIDRMLVLNPIMRLSIFEVLNHPWMKSRCGIPELLETSALRRPPTNQYIM